VDILCSEYAVKLNVSLVWRKCGMIVQRVMSGLESALPLSLGKLVHFFKIIINVFG
jgi:hypothetical protein